MLVSAIVSVNRLVTGLNGKLGVAGRDIMSLIAAHLEIAACVNKADFFTSLWFLPSAAQTRSNRTDWVKAVRTRCSGLFVVYDELCFIENWHTLMWSKMRN